MNALKDIRRRRGWNQRDLARQAGVGQDTISGIESGRHEPRPSTLKKLAAALGVEIAELYGEAAQKEPALLSLAWARAADEFEFYSQITDTPEEDVGRLNSLAGELEAFVHRGIRRVLAERSGKVFEGAGPEPEPGEYRLMELRLEAVKTKVRELRPPFARVRVSDDGNECRWFIPPDQREQHRGRVDALFGGESYRDMDARGEAVLHEETPALA